MQDLSIMHTTQELIVEEIIPLGTPSTTRRFFSADDRFTGETLLPLSKVGVDPNTVEVSVDGAILTASKTSPPPPGQYFFISEADISDNITDAVELNNATYISTKVKFSTVTDDSLLRFEVRGRNLQGTQMVLLAGLDEASNLDVLNSQSLRFSVPKDLESVATLEYVQVLTFGRDLEGSGPIILDLSTRASTASGTKIMTQRFLTLLLDPAVGNLEKLVPKTGPSGARFASLIISRLSLSVGLVVAEMAKTTPNNAAPEEILATATVLGLNFITDSDAEARIRLVSRAGPVSTVPVSLRT